VFDRFGTEYSLEEVFFAQDKRGRTYLYAEDHGHRKRLETLSAVTLKLQELVRKNKRDLDTANNPLDPRQTQTEEVKHQIKDLTEDLRLIEEQLETTENEREALKRKLQEEFKHAEKEFQESYTASGAENNADQTSNNKSGMMTAREKAEYKMNAAKRTLETGIRTAEFVYNEFGGLIGERLQSEMDFTHVNFVPRVLVHDKVKRSDYPEKKDEQIVSATNALFLKGIWYRGTNGQTILKDHWKAWERALRNTKLILWGVFDESDYLVTDARQYAVDDDMQMYILFRNKHMKNDEFVEVAFSLYQESMIGFRTLNENLFSRMNYSVLRQPRVEKLGRDVRVIQDRKFFLRVWMKSHVSTRKPKKVYARSKHREREEDDKRPLSPIHDSDDEETREKKLGRKRREEIEERKKMKKEANMERALEEANNQQAVPKQNAAGETRRGQRQADVRNATNQDGKPQGVVF
jgi:hypothetical protein